MSHVYKTYQRRLIRLLGHMEGKTVSELVALIDDYRDRHGQPSEASIARAIGAAPQTINSWRNRGIKKMPEAILLQKLATLIRVPLETVVLAAARDAGYLTARSDGDAADTAAPIDDVG